MSIDMYQQIVRQVQQLTPDEQLKLMQELIEMQLLDQQIAEKASYLRATCTLRTPDVIQLATALYSQADFFLTNDKQLSAITEIQVLILDNLIQKS